MESELSDIVLQVEQAGQILSRLSDDDLAIWGYDRADLAAELTKIPTAGPRRGGRGASRYTLERKLLAVVRRQVRRRDWLAGLVRKLREACDVLLR